MAERNQVNFTGFRISYTNKIYLLLNIYVNTAIFKLHGIVLFHNLTGAYLWLRTQPPLVGPRAQTTLPFLKSQSLQVKATHGSTHDVLLSSLRWPELHVKLPHLSDRLSFHAVFYLARSVMNICSFSMIHPLFQGMCATLEFHMYSFL